MPRGLGNIPKFNCYTTHPHRNRLAWSWVDERLGLFRQQRKSPKQATKRRPPAGLIINRMVLLKVAGVAPKYHQTNSGSNRTQLRETAYVEHLHSMPLARELEATKASQQLHTKEETNRTGPFNA